MVSVTSNVCPNVMPWGVTSKLIEAWLQGARDAAMVAGSGVTGTVPGWVAETADSTRTLVSGTAPLFSARTERRAVSQLSRMPSLSPPITVIGVAARTRTLAPATGTVVVQALMRPRQELAAPMGSTE